MNGKISICPGLPSGVSSGILLGAYLSLDTLPPLNNTASAPVPDYCSILENNQLPSGETFRGLATNSSFVFLAQETARYKGIIENIACLSGKFEWSKANTDELGYIRVPGTTPTPSGLVICPGNIPNSEHEIARLDAESNLLQLAALTYSPPIHLPGASTEADKALLKIAPQFLAALPPIISPEHDWASAVVFAASQAQDGTGIFGAMLEQYRYLRSTCPILAEVSSEDLEKLVMIRIMLEKSTYLYGEALAEYSHGDLKDPKIKPWIPGSPQMKALGLTILDSPIPGGASHLISTSPELVEQLRVLIDPRYDMVAVDGIDARGNYDWATTALIQGYSQRRAFDEVLAQNRAGYAGSDSSKQAEIRLTLKSAFDNGEFGALLPSSLDFRSSETSEYMKELGRSCHRFFKSDQMKNEWRMLAQSATPN